MPPPARHPECGTQLRPDVRAALPADSKLDWIVKTLSVEERAEMGTELLTVGTQACRTGNLSELAEAVLSWEATAEEIEDSRGQPAPAIYSASRGEQPADLEELD